MLAANEAVAATLSENEIGFLRRAHPDPEPFKLEQFAEFARSLGPGHRPAPEPLRASARARADDRQSRGIRRPLRAACAA